MALTTTENRFSYLGDGVTVQFDFPRYFLAASDLVVMLDGVAQTQSIDYTTMGAGDEAGGYITMTTAPTAGVMVVIYRDPPVTQEAEYTPNDEFPAEVHETALDRGTMIDQRTREMVGQTLRAPEDETGLDRLPGVVARSGGYLGFGATGQPAILGGPSVSDKPTLDNVASISSTDIDDAIDVIQTEGYTSPGDGGGARYRKLTLSTDQGNHDPTGSPQYPASAVEAGFYTLTEAHTFSSGQLKWRACEPGDLILFSNGIWRLLNGPGYQKSLNDNWYEYLPDMGSVHANCFGNCDADALQATFLFMRSHVLGASAVIGSGAVEPAEGTICAQVDGTRALVAQQHGLRPHSKSGS